MSVLWIIVQYISMSILIGLNLMGAYDNFNTWRESRRADQQAEKQEKKCCG